MAIRATTIPFSGGQDTTIDKHLAGLTKFRQVVNGRLDADGRIVARAGYTALPQTCYGSGSHIAYDLFELDGRLCSLGDRRALGHPSDVFEYVEGAAAAWKSTSVTSVAETPRLPRGTRLREIARPPDQKGGVSGFDVAAIAGFVLLVYNDDSSPPLGYSMLVRAGSGQVLIFQEMGDLASAGPARFLRAIGLTTRFLIVGMSTDTTNVYARRIDPASAETWTTIVTALLTDAGGFSCIAADKVNGSDEFLVAVVSAGGVLTVRRYDSAGALIVPSGGQYATFSGKVGNYIAVEGDASTDHVNVAIVNGNTLEFYTWVLSTGATVGTPPYTPAEVVGETCQHVTITHPVAGSQHLAAATVSSIGTPDVTRVMRWTYVSTTGAFGSGKSGIGLRLASGAILTDDTDTLVYGANTDDDETSPNLLIEHGQADDILAVVASKDLGFAMPPVDGTLPRIASDYSRDPVRHYWVHGVQNADGSSIPVLCELALYDPGRRQIARVGRGALISGAMPCWYDGSQVVELGFPERPYIVSITPSTSTGELLPDATYTYKGVYSWFDAMGRLQRSAETLPVDVTMAGTENTNAVVLSGPHTSRHDRGSAPLGSVVRVELYRNRAIVTRTQPVLTGSQNVDPPLSSLNGLTIYIFSFSASGGAQATVTFGAGDTTLTAILATINAQAAGNYLASDAAGGVAITSLASGGAFDYLQINGDAAALDILGFTDGQSANGTTEIERGDTFHLTGTEYTVVGGDWGDRVTITDVRDDDTDDQGIASQAVIYTQLESPLSDCAPLPSDRVWAGVERVEVAGHPQRETWTSSKLVEPGYGVSFAEQGIPGFSGELVESIEAVITQDLSKVYLTRKSIWQVDGEGPALNGQGSFSRARRIFTDGGLVEDGWRSLLETAKGTWMQLGTDKLYLMPPGGAPVWAGFPIRELLRDFPVIAAATLTGNDQLAAFALQSSDGTEGRLALFDLRREVWTVDEISQVPVALADYQGRLCYADSTGVVYMQDTAAGSGAFVPLKVDTANAMLFGAAGQGGVPTVMFVGELLGECTLELEVDYDDGAGFVTAGTFALTAANGYTVGQTVREQFDLALEDCSQFALRASTTGSSGSAGLAFVALEVYAERDAGPALLGDSFRR